MCKYPFLSKELIGQVKGKMNELSTVLLSQHYAVPQNQEK